MKSLKLANIFSGMLLLASAVPARAEPVVIANPAVTATPDIAFIRRLYLGKEKSLAGANVTFALDVDEKSPVRAAFLTKVIEKSETELRQYWSRLIFTGKATPPRNIGGDAAVKDFVARNQDSVGIIDSALVDATVKVLVTVK